MFQVKRNDNLVNFQNSFKDEESFDELAGYRKGFYFAFTEAKSLPKGMEIDITLNDTFKEGDTVNIYAYDPIENKIVLVDTEVIVKNNIVTVEDTTLTHFFITKANIQPIEKNRSYPIFGLILIVILFITNLLTIFLK